jgi:hypothetical protein
MQSDDDDRKAAQGSRYQLCRFGRAHVYSRHVDSLQSIGISYPMPCIRRTWIARAQQVITLGRAAGSSHASPPGTRPLHGMQRTPYSGRFTGSRHRAPAARVLMVPATMHRCSTDSPSGPSGSDHGRSAAAAFPGFTEPSLNEFSLSIQSALGELTLSGTL